MKKLSIIIPHYNEWNNLEKLLLTIPVNSNIETIVIDDWSDKNESKLRYFIEKYSHVYFLNNEQNKKGAGAARNVGLRHAEGEWILFADADDLFLYDFYTKISSYFKSDYDLIYFIPTSFMDKTREESKRHLLYEKYVTNYLDNKSKYNEYRLRYFFVSPTSKLIRHKIIKENNINFEEIRYSNDILFSAKLGFFSNKIEASPKKIYSIRESSNSLTSTVDKDIFIIRFYAWVNYVEFIKSKHTREEFLSMNLTATPLLKNIVLNKLGIKIFYKVFIESWKRNIPIIDKRLFDFNFMRKIIKTQF